MNPTRALIILGSGLEDLYNRDIARKFDVKTRYGVARCAELYFPKVKTIVMMRHGTKHSVPPHLINYRANIQAAKDLHIGFIIATAAVGSVSRTLSIGTYVVLDQFLDFTRNRKSTFFLEGYRSFRHTDMTHPYSSDVRQALIKSLRKNSISRYRTRGTYVCTEGPRYETQAEIRMFQKMGADVVGMTGVPEVVLANEIGIPYGTLAYVTNMGAGLQAKVTQEEVETQMLRSSDDMRRIIKSTTEEMSSP